MTRKQPSRAGADGFSRARVRARRVAVTFVALLVAGELAGCAGIANPYQTASTATKSTSTPTAATRADTGDPTPERNGSVPGHDQGVIDRLGAGAGRASPQAALAATPSCTSTGRPPASPRTSGSWRRSHSDRPARRRSKPPRASPVTPS
jgi:hypothetical protein